MARAEQASHYFEGVEKAVGFSQTMVATIYATLQAVVERHGLSLQDVAKWLRSRSSLTFVEPSAARRRPRGSVMRPDSGTP
jgi:hypothetical protein